MKCRKCENDYKTLPILFICDGCGDQRITSQLLCDYIENTNDVVENRLFWKISQKLKDKRKLYLEKTNSIEKEKLADEIINSSEFLENSKIFVRNLGEEYAKLVINAYECGVCDEVIRLALDSIKEHLHYELEKHDFNDFQEEKQKRYRNNH